MAENTDTSSNESKTVRGSGLLSIGAAGAAVAAVANAAVFGVGRAADVPLVVMDGDTEHVVDVGAVASMSLIAFAVGVVGAVLVYRFFGRRSLRPLGVTGLVLALASNVTFPGAEATAATKWTLAAMHVVVGAVYLAGLEIVRSRTARTVPTSVSDRVSGVIAPA